MSISIIFNIVPNKVAIYPNGLYLGIVWRMFSGPSQSCSKDNANYGTGLMSQKKKYLWPFQRSGAAGRNSALLSHQMCVWNSAT